ncbi:MAG TPA: hypothetical protein VF090_00490 [Methyloceanibacter sp.]
MSGEKNLQNIVSALGVKTSEIKREIKSAQDEINKTKTGIAERRKDQQRLDREITELRAQLSRVPADQKAQRDVVEQRLSSSEAALASAKERLDREESTLTALVDAKREEVARQKLEDETANALIAARTILVGIEDSPVKYVFAKRALDAFAKIEVGPDAFRTLTDKRTISVLLAQFHEAVANAKDRDKKEGERFEMIADLEGDIENARTADTSDTASNAKKSEALRQEQKELRVAIEGLMRPETQAERRARRFRRIAFLISGLVAIIFAVWLFLSPDMWVWAVLPFLVGCALLVSVWFNTEAHRARALRAKQAKLKSNESDLNQLTQHDKKRKDDTQVLVVSYAATLAKLGGNAGKEAGFDELLAETGRVKSDWLSAHPELNSALG